MQNARKVNSTASWWQCDTGARAVINIEVGIVIRNPSEARRTV